MLLLGKFEKFPQYLQLKIERNPAFFDFQPTFKPLSRYTANQLFSAKERNAIIDNCFPFTIRIFMIPELNVLSCQLVSEHFTADQLFGNLFGERDLGQQIRTKETLEVITNSTERMYKWLHNLAGVKLAFTSSQETLEELPRFVACKMETDADGEELVTTKQVFKHMWQRIITIEALSKQT